MPQSICLQAHAWYTNQALPHCAHRHHHIMLLNEPGTNLMSSCCQFWAARVHIGCVPPPASLSHDAFAAAIWCSFGALGFNSPYYVVCYQFVILHVNKAHEPYTGGRHRTSNAEDWKTRLEINYRACQSGHCRRAVVWRSRREKGGPGGGKCGMGNQQQPGLAAVLGGCTEQGNCMHSGCLLKWRMHLQGCPAVQHLWFGVESGYYTACLRRV